MTGRGAQMDWSKRAKAIPLWRGCMVTGWIYLGTGKRNGSWRVDKLDGQYPCLAQKRDLRKRTGEFAVIHDPYVELRDPSTWHCSMVLLASYLGAEDQEVARGVNFIYEKGLDTWWLMTGYTPEDGEGFFSRKWAFVQLGEKWDVEPCDKYAALATAWWLSVKEKEEERRERKEQREATCS
jgi:hypothetical protein